MREAKGGMDEVEYWFSLQLACILPPSLLRALKRCGCMSEENNQLPDMKCCWRAGLGLQPAHPLPLSPHTHHLLHAQAT